MQNTDMGAASAAPVLVHEGEHNNMIDFDQWKSLTIAAIEGASLPEEAEQMIQGMKSADAAQRMFRLSTEQVRAWKRVALLAERKWGELLGPAEHGGKREQVSGGNLTNDVKIAQHKARKVAAVPVRLFNEYLASEENPSRADLLRKHAAPQHRPKAAQRTPEGAKLWEDEAVLTWVTKRKKAKRHRDQIVAESKAGEHGWPVEGKHLPQNAADRALAIIKDRERAGRKGKSKTDDNPKGEAGKRLRELHAEKRGGRNDKLLTMQLRLEEATGSLEGIDALYFGMSDADQELIVKIHDSVTRLTMWADITMKTTIAHMDDAHVVTRIEALRAKAASTQYAAEAETFNAKADELERKRTYLLAGIE